MKNYKAPEIEIVIFSAEDIMTLSTMETIETVDAGNATGVSFSNSQNEIDFN